MAKRLWAGLLVLVLAIAALPANLALAESRTTRCGLMLRPKPTTDSDAILTIPGGTEVVVLGTSGAWTKTSYNGHTGYVATNYLMDLTKSGYFPLKEGDDNQYVKNLQNKLFQLGYYTGTADGEYDAETTKAVSAFQKQNGIGQDGIAGGETQRILFGESAMGVVSSGANNTTADAGSTNTTTAGAAGNAAGTVSNATLRMGDRGEDVKNLQTRLLELGYLTGRADGIFGSGTHKAVVDFQKRSNLTADGKAGKATQSVLYSTGALTASGAVIGATDTTNNTNTNNTGNTSTADTTAYATLKRGMTSNDVKKMQEKLRELGYMSANATGYFGSATLAAVQNFQRSNNLSADGIAGPATQSKLFGTTVSSNDNTNTVVETKEYQALKQGMKSAAVTTMQKKLRELGYMTASATGYFGSQTKAAVIAFQQRNGLTADGVAGNATLVKMYDSIPIVADNSTSSDNGSANVPTSEGTGKMAGPATSSIKLLHWFENIKPSLKSGSTLQIFDPSTTYAWKLKAMSLGRHCDSEPLTAEDTYYMNQAFGNKTTWSPKIVYVKLPSGTWTMATMHNTPHLSGSISTNNFDGHLCVHFLRDMDEAAKNDPKYGVQNQNVLRDGWKKLTGQTITK